MVQTSRPKRWYLVAGFVVIAVALWLLLDSMGVNVPSLKQGWPIFVLLGGVASVLDYFVGSRAPGSLGKGVAGVGLSVLFLAFTYGTFRVLRPGEWWPALPLILGVAFLATWIVQSSRQPTLLVLGVVGIGLGIPGLASKLDWLDRIMPPTAVFWAIALLVLGGYLIWRSVGKSRAGGAGDGSA